MTPTTVVVTIHGPRLSCPSHAHGGTDWERGGGPEPETLPDTFLRAWLAEERAEQRRAMAGIRALEERLHASLGRMERVRTVLGRQPVLGLEVAA